MRRRAQCQLFLVGIFEKSKQQTPFGKKTDFFLTSLSSCEKFLFWSMEIKYSKLHPEAQEPFRANPSDAGYDLFSTQYATVEPFQRKLVSTGINIEIPQGFYGRIAPRSGLACKKGIDIMAGVIDSGYRGEIKVLLINLNFESYNLKPNAFEAMFGSANRIDIKPGDRIAQLIIEKCHEATWKPVNSLEKSKRGEKGFGSSGD